MDNKFTDKDFEKVRWRVDKMPQTDQTDPTKFFPEMLYHKDFTDKSFITHEFRDYYARLICYIVCAYDVNSPFVKHIDNIIRRKREAAEFSGFRKADNNGKFFPFVEEILTNKHDVANRMILRYLRILKNSDWAMFITFQDTLFSQLKTLREDIATLEAKDVKDVIANTTKLRDEISDLEQKFLAGDTSENLIDALYDMIETDDLDLTPEQIAMRFAMKEQPKLYNPYTSDKPIHEFILEHQKLLLNGR